MTKYMLEDVQVGISEGGIACGPVGGSVVVEARVRALDDGTVSYHILHDMEGYPAIFVSNESIYDKLIEEDYEDREFWDGIGDRVYADFDGYESLYESLEDSERCKAEWKPLWHYLAYMASTDWDETDAMKEISVGKVLGEFEVPVCKEEQWYLDSLEDDE